MEIISDINEVALLAGMRNGLGLTKTCEGINLDVKDVSKYIYENPEFLIKLNEEGASGYRQILVATNNAGAKLNMKEWAELKSLLDRFVSSVNVWDQDKPDDGEYEIDHVVEVMTRCKMMEEGLTALGITRVEYYEFIQPHKELEYLVKNNLA